MTCTPLNLQPPSSPSYTSFNLQPPRTPGRRSFPTSVQQLITRPLSIILLTIIRQCTHPRDVIYLIHPRLNSSSLARWQEKVCFSLFFFPRPHPAVLIKKKKKGGGPQLPDKRD
jgi:hypothetical protein